MSVVTDIILTTAVEDGGTEGNPQPNVDQLNRYLKVTYGIPNALMKVDQFGGGDKAVQADVFIGAVNHFSADEFTEQIGAISWEEPECVRVFMQFEQDDGFQRVYFIEEQPCPEPPKPLT